MTRDGHFWLVLPPFPYSSLQMKSMSVILTILKAFHYGSSLSIEGILNPQSYRIYQDKVHFQELGSYDLFISVLNSICRW